MLSSKEITAIYQAILSSPGMDKEVKVQLRIPCKQVLVLSKIIELGLAAKEQEALFSAVDAESLEGVQTIPMQLLQTAGLSDMYNRLHTFQNK
jgi:hypothetical protein